MQRLSKKKGTMVSPRVEARVAGLGCSTSGLVARGGGGGARCSAAGAKTIAQAHSPSPFHRLQDVTNRNTPRAIRARLNFPRRRQVADAGTPEQVAQQVARSSSGKVAMG